MAGEQTEDEFHGSDIDVQIETENRSVAVRNGGRHWLVVSICIFAVVAGQSAGMLLSRFYFKDGGHSRWLRSLLLCIGSPLLLFPILLNPHKMSLLQTFVSARYLFACGGLGLMAAGISVLYSYGISFLPVSTYSLLCATPLVFNAVFSFILVKQRITPSVLNSIILLTFTAVLLVIHSNDERPEGVSRLHFTLGFVFTILACAIDGLLLPLTQLAFQRVGAMENFTIVFLSQAIVFMVAALVCIVGLFSSGDFRYLISESHHFRSGRAVYWVAVVCSAIAWQTFFLGILGLVFLVSSLFSNVISTVTLPLVSILAFFFFHEKLDGVKIMAMLLGLWGFISYAFGGYQDSKLAGSQGISWFKSFFN